MPFFCSGILFFFEKANAAPARGVAGYKEGANSRSKERPGGLPDQPLSAATLSRRSHGNSSRPKWPYDAVGR
jgi:hypothetical protein